MTMLHLNHDKKSTLQLESVHFSNVGGNDQVVSKLLKTSKNPNDLTDTSNAHVHMGNVHRIHNITR